jgi:hypothetical protein
VTAPRQEGRSVNLLQHLTIKLSAELGQFLLFFKRKSLVGMFIKEGLVAVHLDGGGPSASDASQGRIVQPIQDG